ncbi:replication initiation factor domain-containing protein [Candidatus Gracilibacteria bacterium]|nr:replication initiation factor domain-containing protein [Candidatus Gracilibacteria bacterium]
MFNVNKKFENIYKTQFASLDSVVVKSLEDYLKYIPEEVIEKSLLVVKPPANRGVRTTEFSFCQQSFKLNCLLDWLTCSFSFEELRQFFINFGCYDSEFKSFFDQSFRFKTRFYDNSFHFLETGSISTGMIQRDVERTTLLELSGKSLQAFREKFNVSDLDIINNINYTDGNDIGRSLVKITRVDLTLDYKSLNVFSGLLLWDNILIHLKKKAFSSCANSSSIQFISSCGDYAHVQTIYIGSRSSGRFLCIYLKHEESVDKRETYIENFVIRFELRLTENHAYSFKKNSESCKNDSDFFNLIRSLINDFIEFKDIDNFNHICLTNRYKLDIAPFWKDVFKLDLKIDSYPTYKDDSIFRKIKHAKKMSLNLHMIKQVDEKSFNEIMEEGKNKFDNKLDKNNESLNNLRKQFNRVERVNDEEK